VVVIKHQNGVASKVPHYKNSVSKHKKYQKYPREKHIYVCFGNEVAMRLINQMKSKMKICNHER
jgi:hypothetical protein